MSTIQRERLTGPFQQVAASSLVTIVLTKAGELWWRGYFVDTLWERIDPIMSPEFEPVPVVQYAIRDFLGLDYPQWEIVAITAFGELYEYATERGGWEKKWRAL